MKQSRKDFEQTMLKAAGVFIADVLETGREVLSVDIDREDESFICNIGRAGGCMLPMEDFETAPEVACEFAVMLVAQANEVNANVNFTMTTKLNDSAEIEVTVGAH